jgi:hypothetical protein
MGQGAFKASGFVGDGGRKNQSTVGRSQGNRGRLFKKHDDDDDNNNNNNNNNNDDTEMPTEAKRIAALEEQLLQKVSYHPTYTLA